MNLLTYCLHVCKHLKHLDLSLGTNRTEEREHALWEIKPLTYINRFLTKLAHQYVAQMKKAKTLVYINSKRQIYPEKKLIIRALFTRLLPSFRVSDSAFSRKGAMG